MRGATGHARRQAGNALPRSGAHSETRCGAGDRGGPVAWQPPHRQDGDLVPLTAGACSPHPGSSRRIPRQTSGPDPNPHDNRGAAPRRHHATAEPCPTRLPDGRSLGWLGEAALSCLRIGSEAGMAAAGRKPRLVRAVGASIEPSSAWQHGHLRSGQRPMSRDRQVGGPTSDRRQRLFWVVCGRSGWLPSVRSGSRLG
jgi:hypothetical protein